MRVYGSLSFDADRRQWVITCESQVTVRLKRVFARLSTSSFGEHRLSDTADNARDLEWFLERYPLKVAGGVEAHLRARSREQRERQETAEAILAGRVPPTNIELALPLREYQKQAVAMMRAMRGLLLADDVGIGKAQPLDAKVLTPSGWRRMGDLRVGDAVIDPDGGTATVEGVFPQGEREVFRVTMADGGSTECCDEHLWMVQTPNDRCRAGGRVLPLREIRERLHETRGNGQRAHHWFLPLVAPVLGAQDPLPIDPWLLGVILGDGNCAGDYVRVSCADPELVERMRRSVPAGISVNHAGRVDWRLARTDPSRRNPLLEALRALGIDDKRAWEKSIPEPYLRAHPEARLELLRGLMDTDGTCSQLQGVATFTSTSEVLCRQVLELARSLGGVASIWNRVTNYTYLGELRQGRRSWTANIRLPVNPFWLGRKAVRWRMPTLARAIESVEPVGREPVQCIRVSSKRRLYITDDFIVTHNTASAIGLLADPNMLPALVVTLTHLPTQWEAEIKRFAPKLRVHTLKKATPYPLNTGGLPSKAGRKPLVDVNPDVIVSNYHKLAGWAEALSGQVKTVVFDEIQELRIAKSDKYSAAKHIAAGAEYRVGLSATPIYNQGSEFHAIAEILRPDALGTREEFVREWCTAGYREGTEKIRDPRAFGEFVREAGLMLRRTRSEVGRELPALTRVPQHVDANLGALDKVSEACRELALFILGRGASPMKLEGDAKKGEKLLASEELSIKLRQATGIAKAPFVADFVQLLVEQGEKVVLFGWHREVYRIWRERLANLEPVMYTGSETAKEKDAARDAFIDGQSKVLIMSLRAGAGLDGLQKACRTVVFGELDWSYGVHEQAEGRVNRDGQSDPVVAYYLTTDTGSDPIVMDVLGIKRGQLEGIRDPKAAFVSKLETDPDRIKKLAEAYLAQHGLEPAAEVA